MCLLPARMFFWAPWVPPAGVCPQQRSGGHLGPRGLFQLGEPQGRQELRGCPSRARITPLSECHPQRGQSPLAVTPWGAGDRGSAMATSLHPQSCHHRLRLPLLPLKACILVSALTLKAIGLFEGSEGSVFMKLARLWDWVCSQ